MILPTVQAGAGQRAEIICSRFASAKFS